MKSLPWPDHHYLHAAEAWLELGNTEEASAEARRIAPEHALHPDVLNVRWQILSSQKDWDACLDVARAIIQSAPESAAGWIHLSYTLHELGRTQEAWDNL